MKTTHLKSLYLANAPLAITSLLLGYSFWYIASYNHLISFQCTIPLYFYDISPLYTINAPEKITVTLTAKRSDFYLLDRSTLAAHININELLPGTHAIILTKEHLLLSKNIALTHYKPTNLSMIISEK